MTTIEEFVLARSYLPKDGTHTMIEHIMAMTMYVYGLEAKLTIEDKKELVIVTDKLEYIVVSDESNLEIEKNATGSIVVEHIKI